MKLHQILSVSTLALIGLSSPFAAVASIGPEFEIGQVSVGRAALIAPSYGTFELSRRGRGRDDAPGDDRGRGRGKDDVRTGMTANGGTFELARRGADDNGKDDRGGDRGRGRGADDDHRGHHGRGADDNGNDNRRKDESGRRNRVPGGSGCDSAGDIAEHAGCQG